MAHKNNNSVLHLRKDYKLQITNIAEVRNQICDDCHWKITLYPHPLFHQHYYIFVKTNCAQLCSKIKSR